ncbi:unnamed protein product [Vitrella brassicaformis CCMP3155]|uniref:PPIase cyclophilin-type domain-containing protein n=1 Tax=Vitrella brassicaformis (strain CCMP3155) TaxID=1169540 RepID=A0A0G4GB05_VITBC|nr:unnamed protein product [Vitrella brassicaformis CCMP3155]|eukprot:CEM26325.1 unnamed protein product [Vitrella brassicaformis CCMP3155]
MDLHLYLDPLFLGFGADVCVVDATFGGESGASECSALRFLPLAMSPCPSTEDVTRSFSAASAAIRDLQREGISTVRFVTFGYITGSGSPHLYLLDEGVLVIPTVFCALISALETAMTKTFSGMPLAVLRDHLLDFSSLAASPLERTRWSRFVRHATGSHLVPSVDEKWVGEWVRQALWARQSVLATALDAKADQDMAKLKSRGKAIDKGVLVKQQLGRLERDAVAEFMRVVDSFKTAEPKPIDQLLNTLTGRPLADARLPSVDDPETAREKEEAVLDRLAEERRQANDLTETVKRLRDFERSIKNALAINDTANLLATVYQLDMHLTMHVDYTHWAKLLKETTDLWRTICFKVKPSPDKQVKAECAKFLSNMTEGFLCAQKRPKVFFDLKVHTSSRSKRIVIDLFPDVNPKAAENFRCFCTGEKGNGTSGYPLRYRGSAIPYAVKGCDLIGGYLPDGDSLTSMTESTYGANHSKWDHNRSLIAARRAGMVLLMDEAASQKRGIQNYREHGGRFMITVASANSAQHCETAVGFIPDLKDVSFLQAVSLMTDFRQPQPAPTQFTLGDLAYGPQIELQPLIVPVIIQDCGQLPDQDD